MKATILEYMFGANGVVFAPLLNARSPIIGKHMQVNVLFGHCLKKF